MWIRIDQPLPLPAEVKQILQTILSEKFEAYVVGGAVRDFLLNRQMKDMDIATSAHPDKIKELFPNAIEVGRAFGTMKIPVTGSSGNVRLVEVTTFRSESGYADHRHPSNVEFSTIEKDSARRDFTVNSFYYDHRQQKIYDPWNGMADIKARVIRAIGVPEERFQEDALRLLRAIRFASNLGFEIEPVTLQAVRTKSDSIRKISIERVRDELEQLWLSADSARALNLLHSTQMLYSLFPEWLQDAEIGKRVLESVARHVSVAKPAVRTPELQWGLLFLPWFRLLPQEQKDSGLAKILDRFKFSTEFKNHIRYLLTEVQKLREVFQMRNATLYRLMLDPKFSDLLEFHKYEALATDGNLAYVDWIESQLPEVLAKANLPKLLNGDDLQALGVPPGKDYSRILSSVEDLILEGKITTKQQALDQALKVYLSK